MLEKKVQISRRRLLSILSIAILLSSALSVGIYVYANGGSTTPTFATGPYPGAPTYTIWNEGSTYFAKNAYGAIDYSGINATTVANAVMASGRWIYFKEGNYMLDGRIQVPSNSKLTGSGWGTIFWREPSSGDHPLITNSDWTNGNHNITLANFKLDGQRAGTFIFSTGGLLHLVKTSEVVVDGIYAVRGRTEGMEVVRSTYVSITNSYFEGNGDDGLSFSDGDFAPGGIEGASENRGITVSNCYAINNNADAHASGFEADDGNKEIEYINCYAYSNYFGFQLHRHGNETFPENIRYIGVVARGNEYGLGVRPITSYPTGGTPTSTQFFRRITISGSQFIDNTMGIYLARVDGAIVTGNVIINDYVVGVPNETKVAIFVAPFQDLSNTPIYFSSRNVIITNNEIINSGWYGIQLHAVEYGGVISNNIIRNTAYGGIHIGVRSSEPISANYMIISNNVIYDVNLEGATDVRNSGISFRAAAGSITNITISNNMIYDLGTVTQQYGIGGDESGGQLGAFLIHGNYIHRWVQTGDGDGISVPGSAGAHTLADNVSDPT